MAIISTVLEQQTLLRRWFFEEALPLWWHIGGDRKQGGFFEKIDDSLNALEEPRRARLVSRQIYVYSVASELGWNGPCAQIVEHGLNFLIGKLLCDDGTVIASVRADGVVVKGAFDLYDYAFVLFGLAAAAYRLGDRQELSRIATRICDRMIKGWAHPVAGFEETQPTTIPLRANPHMHLLEAFLAWAKLEAERTSRWNKLADDMVKLCLSRFIDPETGVLREFFDHDWRPLLDKRGRIMEPGHQFEWAWLLLQWATLRGRSDVVPAALRLIEIGEGPGIDTVRNVVVNELYDDLTLRDGRARLWPQTERIKAWSLMLKMAQSSKERDVASDRLAGAIAGLRLYFTGKPAGLWWETMQPDGSFDPEPARASSLYHIACAIHTMAA